MIVVLCVFAGSAVLMNAWASMNVWTHGASSFVQKIAQTAFVWALPVAGALLVFSLLREERTRGHEVSDGETCSRDLDAGDGMRRHRPHQTDWESGDAVPDGDGSGD